MAEQTTSSIVINASPEEIMAVIADLERYPEWSAGMKSVEVLTVYDDADERPASARFSLDMSGIKDTYTLDYDWHGLESVTWTLGEGSVLKAMDGEYALHDNGDGTTTVDYALAVDVSIPMLGMMKRRAEKIIIDTALKGLKKRVEG
jgi:ribosome-associated toxin RatA of RatAB toxin-antitoxin module